MDDPGRESVFELEFKVPPGLSLDLPMRVFIVNIVLVKLENTTRLASELTQSGAEVHIRAGSQQAVGLADSSRVAAAVLLHNLG